MQLLLCCLFLLQPVAPITCKRLVGLVWKFVSVFIMVGESNRTNCSFLQPSKHLPTDQSKHSQSDWDSWIAVAMEEVSYVLLTHNPGTVDGPVHYPLESSPIQENMGQVGTYKLHWKKSPRYNNQLLSAALSTNLRYLFNKTDTMRRYRSTKLISWQLIVICLIKTGADQWGVLPGFYSMCIMLHVGKQLH